VLLSAGCATPGGAATDRTLVIRWQRLVDEAGDTCGRCGHTERALAEAQRLLTASLRPLGLHVRVVRTQLTAEQFELDPSASNRIWIGDEPLDTILGAQAGATTCAGVCGGSPCRTMQVDGRTYESIPAELIVRAGLRVAADLVRPAAPSSECCPPGERPLTPAEPALQPMPWLTPESPDSH
jgi:hypothetical protein